MDGATMGLGQRHQLRQKIAGGMNRLERVNTKLGQAQAAGKAGAGLAAKSARVEQRVNNRMSRLQAGGGKIGTRFYNRYGR